MGLSAPRADFIEVNNFQLVKKLLGMNQMVLSAPRSNSQQTVIVFARD